MTQIRFSKVLSLCIAKDESVRRAAEGELCSQMSSVECKPAYFAIPTSMMADVERAKALVRNEGFDGVVAIRVLDVGERVTYEPPVYGPGFWGYYGYDRPAYRPAYYRSDEVVVLETTIFSLVNDERLWVGTTETVNPKSLPKLIEEVAEAVRDELLRKDLIPEPS